MAALRVVKLEYLLAVQSVVWKVDYLAEKMVVQLGNRSAGKKAVSMVEKLVDLMAEMMVETMVVQWVFQKAVKMVETMVASLVDL